MSKSLLQSYISSKMTCCSHLQSSWSNRMLLYLLLPSISPSFSLLNDLWPVLPSFYLSSLKTLLPFELGPFTVYCHMNNYVVGEEKKCLSLPSSPAFHELWVLKRLSSINYSDLLSIEPWPLTEDYNMSLVFDKLLTRFSHFSPVSIVKGVIIECYRPIWCRQLVMEKEPELYNCQARFYPRGQG